MATKVAMTHRHCQIVVTMLVAMSMVVYYAMPESNGLFAIFDILAVLTWIWLE